MEPSAAISQSSRGLEPSAAVSQLSRVLEPSAALSQPSPCDGSPWPRSASPAV